MSELAPDDVVWAAEAYASGRPMDFIASVLGVKPRQAFIAIKKRRVVSDMHAAPERAEMSAERQRAEAKFRAAIATENQQYASKLAPYRRFDEEGEFFDKPQNAEQQEAMNGIGQSLNRRRNLLRIRFAKHWEMIWFLRRKRMSGRTLRQIYGADALIWSVGGGVTDDIEFTEQNPTSRAMT